MRLLPLLAGRLEIAEATLVRPHLTMDLARPPAIAGAIAQAASAPAATLEADRTDEVRLGVLRVQSGSAFLQRHGEPDIIIDHVDGSDRMTLRAEMLGDRPAHNEAVVATMREITKLRGDVALYAPGALPNDGKVIDDIRKLD